MTTQDLNEYILHYLKKDKTQTAIMLTGEWGSGKTYYIEKELVPYLKEQQNVSCVSVSLYGLESITEISKAIYMELRFPTYNKMQSEAAITGKVIAKSAIKHLIARAGVDLTVGDQKLEEIYESVNLKDKLLILEDVERSNIDILKILGYVNGLVERDNAKVVLVANENEILGKNKRKKKDDIASLIQKNENDFMEMEISENVTEYLRIKEKTVSDTIYFDVDLKKPIREICNSYKCDKINNIVNDEYINKLSVVVADKCNKNLRTVIFALQKTVDIIERIGDIEVEDDFYEILLMGILLLSSMIKSSEFPKWEGSTFLSTKLASNETPLMRFAYEYVRWQTFETDAVLPAYNSYKKYKFAEQQDSDLRILVHYAEQTERAVVLALHNIEEKLQKPDIIGIETYGRLAYYIIYVGNIVDFDFAKSFELMLKNAKDMASKTNIESDILWADFYDIKDENLSKKYKGFMEQLADTIKNQKWEKEISYDSSCLEQVYADICKDKYKYIVNHRFISKYDIEKLLYMLQKSTSKEMNLFRGILFAVYRNVTKGEFDEEDTETMKKFKSMLEEEMEQENDWDKIQKKQIECLINDLSTFIEQME